MRLPTNQALRLVYQSVRCRAKSSTAKPDPIPPQPLQARPTSPFDSLGYQLLDQPQNAEPQAVHRSVIDALGPTSFTISGVRISGSVLVMPFFSTLWNVDSIEHVQPPAFSLVKLLHPRPDIVIVGTGANLLPVSPQLREFFKEIKVNLDAMDTKNACHTFNVLNQEGRNAAVALFPVGYTHHQNIT